VAACIHLGRDITQQILTSVIQTARLRALDPRELLLDRLRAAQPTGSLALATVPWPGPADQTVSS
jgi:hypothetical protein